MSIFKKTYGPMLIGVALGVVYGLATRLIFEKAEALDSITYLIVTPLVLGIVPMLMASESQLRALSNIFRVPAVTVAVCLLAMFITELEVLLCLLIFALPFILMATLGAFIVRQVRLYYIDKKKTNPGNTNGRALGLLLVPFLLSPLEKQVTSPTAHYHVTSEVIIAATPETIWSNIVAVRTITPTEYKGGFFQAAGIPRPIEATVTKQEVNGQRIGHFEGGLRFTERITTCTPNHTIAFSIAIAPESIPDDVFQQHVLRGSVFAFSDAAYTLTPLPGGRIKLTLASGYTLTSNINFYGRLWADLIVKDFQDRLLAVIQTRCEQP